MKEQISMLQKLGLTEYQSKVFVALLSRSESTAPELAKLSGVPVTKIYSILKSLEDMSFLKSSLTRPKMYRPVDAQIAVDSILVKKQEKINEMLDQRKKIISSLDKLYESNGKKYEDPENLIWLVTGVETGMIELVKLVKSAKKSVHFISTHDDVLLGASNIDLMNTWIDAVTKKNVKIKEIEPKLTLQERLMITKNLLGSVNGTKGKINFIKIMKKYFSNYSVRELSSKDVHFSFFIIDSKIMLLLLNNPIYSTIPYGLIISDKNIVSGFLDYFNSLWDFSKDTKKNWLGIYSNLGKSLLKKYIS